MSNMRNKFSLEVRARAVRMVLENEGDYSSLGSDHLYIGQDRLCTTNPE